MAGTNFSDRGSTFLLIYQLLPKDSSRTYSAIARPLEELTGKYARFTWETGQEKAFREIREARLTAPVLKLADVNKPFRVMSDASDSAIGGVSTSTG